MAAEKKPRKAAPSPGNQPKGKAMVFQFRSPDSKEAKIAGSFNDWKPQPLKRDSKGIWKVKILLEPGAHEYKFLVDDQWVEDPQNPDKSPSPFGGYNSICVVS